MNINLIVTLVVAFGSVAVLIFGAFWCRALDQLRVGVYALGLTLALMLPVILLLRARLRARIAANVVAAERSRLMVPFKATIGWMLISIIPLFFHSVGAVLIVNRALDFSQPTCHETRWTKWCPGSPPSLVVASWRPGREEESFSMTSCLIRELEQDSVIEVCTKKGWLGLEWVRSVRVVHQAISDQTRALGTNPRNAEFYFGRGITYANKGQLDQAISDFTKGLEIKPRYAEAYNTRGILYDKKGQYDQAILDYTKALEISPTNADAYNNRGIAYSHKGQHDQAISDCTKALEINPGNAAAYNNRGIAYFHNREYEKSWRDVEKARSLGYQIDPEFLDNLRKASGRQN